MKKKNAKCQLGRFCPEPFLILFRKIVAVDVAVGYMFQLIFQSIELLFRDLKRSGPPLTAENEDRLKSQLKHISFLI